MTRRPIRLAVDIGGTFVDAMELDTRTNRVRFRKAATTPARPADGVLNAIGALGTDLSEVELFIHGTTLGLNAVLERRGGRTGIITNEGFRDIFLIGRGNVRSDHMYAFQYQRPERLVQRRFTAGVRGRLDYRGRVVEPLDPDSVREAARTLVVDQQVTSIAICFLHSFLDPSHEREAARLIHEEFPEVSLSLSTDIVREYREYERTSTTVLEAYIRPIFERYVDELESGLAERGFAGRFLIMRSGGGSMTSAVAKTAPTHTVLSGPAGGIVGAAYVASELGRDNVLTFDIGGTSLDACVIERGNPVAAYEAQLEHFPLLIPTYDIRTIGAGGGSIAWLDHGLLKVGPQSAGADPGPVCYGRGGTQPTVTDAHLVLGHLPDGLLDGSFTLDRTAARRAIDDKIAKPLGLSVDEAARGILEIIDSTMLGAIRVVSVERGHDPRDFVLVPFGGAGPLHGGALSRLIGCPVQLVPPAPGVLSALGLLASSLRAEFSRSCVQRKGRFDLAQITEVFQGLERDALEWLEEEGVSDNARRISWHASLRYEDQGSELTLPWVGRATDQAALDQVLSAFHAEHERLYSFRLDDVPVERGTLRVDAVGLLPALELGEIPARGPAADAVVGRQRISLAGGPVEAPVYDRARLGAGATFEGPAIVKQLDATTLLLPEQTAEMHKFGSLIVREK